MSGKDILQDFVVHAVKEPNETAKHKGKQEMDLLLEEPLPLEALKCGCEWKLEDGVCYVTTVFPVVRDLLTLWIAARGYEDIVIT